MDGSGVRWRWNIIPLYHLPSGKWRIRFLYNHILSIFLKLRNGCIYAYARTNSGSRLQHLMIMMDHRWKVIMSFICVSEGKSGEEWVQCTFCEECGHYECTANDKVHLFEITASKMIYLYSHYIYIGLLIFSNLFQSLEERK